MKKIPLLMLGTAMILALGACQTTGQHMDASTQSKIDALADSGSSMREDTTPLPVLEQMYKTNPSDPSVAVRYAHALREAGRLDRALMVVSSFAQDDKKPDFNAKLEYASIQAELGDYADSEAMARQAVLMNPDSGQGYHVLGVALDAQGLHPQAEVAFRKALDHWEGDPSSLLNNLGLNLAAQGNIDEALETLRKAQAAAPDRVEIERNIRIVSALQYSPPKTGFRVVPVPTRKPGDTHAEVKKPHDDTQDAAASSAPETKKKPAKTASNDEAKKFMKKQASHLAADAPKKGKPASPVAVSKLAAPAAVETITGSDMTAAPAAPVAAVSASDSASDSGTAKAASAPASHGTLNE
jgi:Flp pilus assembly protein TadD